MAGEQGAQLAGAGGAESGAGGVLRAGGEQQGACALAQGVGYRASLRGTDLELNVGYSHSVVIKPRAGITFEVPAPTQVIVKGTDKQQVGQTAAEVRQVRPPEPYKGKGIRYEGEQIRRKVGKRA